MVYGTGNALRQFLYVDDFSRVILNFIDLQTDKQEISCIVSPPENSEVSIKKLIETIKTKFKFDGNIVYDNTYSDGQYKKTTTDSELLEYFPDFNFTNLQDGLENVVEFFTHNYEATRK